MTKKTKYTIVSHARHAPDGVNEIAYNITDLDAFIAIAEINNFEIVKIIKQEKTHIDDFCDVT